MPTFVHGKGTQILLNQYDLSQYFNSVDSSQSIETADTTGFGSSAKSYITGLSDATLSLSGMFEQSASGSDAVLQTALGAAVTPIITIIQGSGVIGNVATLAKAHETSYSISTPVGDVVSISVDFNASTDTTSNLTYGLRNGKILTTGGSIAFGALGGLTSVDNAASSSAGGVANLHVTANTITGGATTIKVQSSADNSTWADLVTFTAVTASTLAVQQTAVSGSVPRYLRAFASTAGTAGSITFNVGFARF
jgi:hypothetical protein